MVEPNAHTPLDSVLFSRHFTVRYTCSTHQINHSEPMRWAPIPSCDLNFFATLHSGQTFRWRSLGISEWLGAAGDAVIRIRSREDGFWWQTYPSPDRWDVIDRYFALEVDLKSLYKDWRAAEPRIGGAIERFAGLRILRQEPTEAFFSFLCASCNTIVKITRSIQALERRTCNPLARIDGEMFYRFPEPHEIAALSEADLRSDLWGYRAPRLIQLAKHVTNEGPEWLDDLARSGYRPAHSELVKLFGIGSKIADCICLFGFGHDEAVPIDTHVRRIAVSLFRREVRSRTLTDTVYRELSDLFRERFGHFAGWAQQYLFLEDLQKRAFRVRSLER